MKTLHIIRYNIVLHWAGSQILKHSYTKIKYRAPLLTKLFLSRALIYFDNISRYLYQFVVSTVRSTIHFNDGDDLIWSMCNFSGMITKNFGLCVLFDSKTKASCVYFDRWQQIKVWKCSCAEIFPRVVWKLIHQCFFLLY